MKTAIAIVSILAFILIGMLFYQYDQLAFQISQSPSFRIGNPDQMPVKPSKISLVKNDSVQFSLFEFTSDSGSKPIVILPGIGLYMSDWFAFSKQIADSGFHVFTLPLEFSETNQIRYSWGKQDAKNLQYLIDSLIHESSVKIIAFDFGSIALDQFKTGKNVSYILINPKSNRSGYVGLLVDLSFGFSIDSKNKKVWEKISELNQIPDQIKIDGSKISHVYFNPNIAISEPYLHISHSNLISNWEYGTFNSNELKSLFSEKRLY